MRNFTNIIRRSDEGPCGGVMQHAWGREEKFVRSFGATIEGKLPL